MQYKRGYYDVFVRTCAKFPTSVAIRHYHDDVYKTYTYSELYGVCEYIAQILQQMISNSGIIGLVTERNIIIPCVIASAHKCCTTFMFLDPTQDVETIANELKFKMVIVIAPLDSDLQPDLFHRKPDKTVTIFGLNIHFYNLQPIQQHSKHLIHHSFIASTSGTTGKPKRIQVPIQCIQPNINDLTKLFSITPNDVIYFSTPLTFDPSMVEILLACMNGASLLIAPEKIDLLFPKNQENAITFWQTTPSRFFQHSNHDIENKILSAHSPLKILALGGEPFNGVKRLKEMKHEENQTKIYTLYGVTEMSCWATVAELDLNKTTDREVPLGSTLSETQLVLEPFKQEGNHGKIILVSKTRKCIVLNKSKDKDEEENSMRFMVDTGDIGEIKNGTIYYRGRKDDIIKKFGHKINLQVIEQTIMQCPRVKTCSCIWMPKPMLIVVYYCSDSLTTQELSDFLKCKLDDSKYWPDKIIRVDNVPTTSHGKVAKNVLSEMYEKKLTLQVPVTKEFLKASFVKEIQTMLSKNVKFEDIKNSDFFSVGGTSFLAVSMCNKLSQASPEFGKAVLPHLLTPKNNLGEILDMVLKELTVDQKAKRKLKRVRSTPESCNSNSLKRSATPSVSMEFIVLWSFDTGKCVDASPTLFKSEKQHYVTVGSHSGTIVTLDAITGVVLGLIKLKSRVEAPVLCFPSASGGVSCGAVGAYDGSVVCFSLCGARELWRAQLGATVKSRAVYCSGMLYVAAYDGNLCCINSTTGTVSHRIQIQQKPISADLVLAKNQYVLVGTLSGLSASVDTTTSTVAWREPMGSPIFSSPVLYDNDKYAVFALVSGEIHCRTVEKGIKIWKFEGAKGNIFSSLSIKPLDKFKWQMIFGCHDNLVYSVMIKNILPTLHWTSSLASPVYSTPCYFGEDGVLAVSNTGTLYVLDLDTGAKVSEFSLPGEIFSTPAVYENYVFIGCRNDHLYSLRYVVM